MPLLSLGKNKTCRLCLHSVSLSTQTCSRCNAWQPAYSLRSLENIAICAVLLVRVLISLIFDVQLLSWIDFIYVPAALFFLKQHLYKIDDDDKAIIELRRYDPDKVYPSWQKVAAEHRAKKTKKPTAKSDVLSFVYEDADGNVSTRKIVNWQEDDVYFEGFCLDRHEGRTFKKERVLRYLDASERFLKNSNPVVTEFKKSSKRVKSSEILFTGFSKAERAKLEGLARYAGLAVCQSVTVGLDYICTGKKAGPAKLAQALAHGAVELSVDEFYQLVETGEVPSN